MNLEICITADKQAEQALLSRLGTLFTEQPTVEKCGPPAMASVTLSYFCKTPAPDTLLQEINSIILEIEDRTLRAGAIEVRVRNIEYSEPVLSGYDANNPFCPADNLRIVPWQDDKNPPADVDDIFLLPSAVFGTGLHPSTRLCLQLLHKIAVSRLAPEFSSCTVLDIGCGSGILSIAALRLGAARTLGVEIDPAAVRIARRNIALNRLAHRAEIKESSWQEISTTYDLILANLVPSVLFRAAPGLTDLLSDRGLLIAAGFPDGSIQKVSQLLGNYGLFPVQESAMDGWGALLLSRDYSKESS